MNKTVRNDGSRQGFWSRAASATASAPKWFWMQIQSTVDRKRWRDATTWGDRWAAIDPRRAGAGVALTMAVVGACTLLAHLNRPLAYPPQNPPEEELQSRRELREVTAAPPASLVEASRSVGA